MMKVSVTVNTTDLTDLELQQMSQLGVDCIDFGVGHSFAGVKEQGFPDFDKLVQLKEGFALGEWISIVLLYRILRKSSCKIFREVKKNLKIL